MKPIRSQGVRVCSRRTRSAHAARPKGKEVVLGLITNGSGHAEADKGVAVSWPSFHAGSGAQIRRGLVERTAAYDTLLLPTYIFLIEMRLVPHTLFIQRCPAVSPFSCVSVHIEESKVVGFESADWPSLVLGVDGVPRIVS